VPQFLLTGLLWVVLLAAAVTFAAMGILQARRTRRLARDAYEIDLRFSHGDPFDLPMRYRSFALIRTGHSPMARNVSYGRQDAWPVRCFDFRYEAGHGPRRVGRNYRVYVVETAGELQPVVMWHDQDRDWTPLEAQPADGRIGPWSYKGSPRATDVLAEICEDLAEQGASMQAAGRALMLCLPARSANQPDRAILQYCLHAARRLDSWKNPAPGSDEGDASGQNDEPPGSSERASDAGGKSPRSER
jgi:hypothetical protein